MNRGRKIGRRAFLETGAALGAAPLLAGSAGGQPEVELAEAPVDSLQDRMQKGTLTSRELVQACLRRIEALDRTGPTLASVIETNPDALSIAAALDEERRSRGPRGPLHGIPVLLKDNIDTAGRMTTTAGSLALEGSIPSRDATLAARLRSAGAVLIGKANMSEWANFRSARSSSGWSARGGQCRNPYALDRNPCGSSSGSAVAVAAGLVPLAVGTETDGSIVCPSSANGLVGVKPTLGLVSRTGVVPIASSQDTAGPMARTVREAAILLSALAGADTHDEATRNPARPAAPDYARALDAAGLSGARIGVWRKTASVDPRVGRLFERALGMMRECGALLVDPVESPALAELDEPEMEVLLFEFKACIASYLSSLPRSTGPRSLADLIAFNDAYRDRELRFFDQELFRQAEGKGPLSSPAYQEALSTCRRLARSEGLDPLLSSHGLDAIVAPTGGPAWMTDLINGDHFTGIGFSTPAAVAGYPHVTVPMGLVFGLPVGLSFVGPAWSEPTLLRLAFAFERATGARRPPTFRPTADLSGA